MISLAKVKQLLALAFDGNTSEEERKTAAAFACRGLVELKLLSREPDREKALETCTKFQGRNLWRDLFGNEEDVLPKARQIALCPLCGTSVPHVHGVSPEHSHSYVNLATGRRAWRGY